MNSGSFFLAEIRRMMSSFNPLGILSSSTSVTKPHLYSRPARSWMVFTSVLIAFSGLKTYNGHQISAGIPDGRQMQGLDQIRKHYIIQGPSHRLADDPLIVLDRTARLQVAQPGDVGAAFSERNRTLEFSNDFSHGDLSRRPGQAVSAFDATVRNQQPTLQKLLQQLAHCWQGQP